ncbi:circularly permuted type 2 ATP-grasp protein [Azoarcus sp. L1K30]|uniref:circularly permuted type 2 ATP-grasp protein n=1 Tax=Azoarcus sp. L1K30 TaxID=2820277 RepID=UPI001B83D821|nr:circularly permuted type 2 ATP-grasp protein [Azoarcus sp. L1K30]MBR0565751.1 circularly permuted type 2 ATP-grasp protein [Azoarcus sp. L1K30]
MPVGLTKNYPLSDNRFDEMMSASGEARPHWQSFVDRLEGFPDETLTQRAAFVRSAIESDGVSYNVYADPKGTKRPWELDMLPLIVGNDEWQMLSTAIAQRARLLNAILADLYGPQHLLAEGLLPPALVFGQHGFKWPARGLTPPGNVWLFSYAADLARAPDGRWWVIADRTQGPSGAGYALQNRIIVSRAFPDAFRELHVNPLANYFRTMQDSLARLAPADGDVPLTVLLTPGPYNETYFEHAFLARYLGFPLVEGQDLTVRDNTVFLKTLRGLRRVHAILRRLDDDFCDPLELRSDSALGIPGLLGAIRAGRVLMANAVGSGVLESGALFGFLPAICERLLGEKMAMPSVASWWCGEPPALEYVLDHLDELVIKPAFPSMRMEAVFGHELKGDSRRRMIERILAQPHAYVAQEWVRLSQAPVWNRRLLPRSVGIRVFASATPEGYNVMPGALGRIAPRAGMEVISMQRGGLSKDTWIRAEAPVVRTTLLKRRLAVIDLVCGGADIPSRVGENLFWMGRYAERVEAGARLLRAAFVRAASTDAETESGLQGVLQATRRLGIIVDDDEDKDETRPDDIPSQLLRALLDHSRPGSVASNLRALSFSASQVRERLSSDNWHALNRLEQLLSEQITSIDQALSAIDRVMQSCISLAGFAMDDMTRDEGWRFLILGRRIERLEGLAGLIRVPMQAEPDARERMFEWLLEAANSIVTYRARYRRTPELLPLIHLLVFDRTNPHSVGFQVDVLQKYLARSARELGHPYPSLLIDPLARRLENFDLTRFEADDCELAMGTLGTLLNESIDTALNLSDEVHRRYFTHTLRPMRLRRVA